MWDLIEACLGNSFLLPARSVQVLEQVQQVDNGDSMEDLLQAVTERVQQRQAQRQQVAKSAAKVIWENWNLIRIIKFMLLF